MGIARPFPRFETRELRAAGDAEERPDDVLSAMQRFFSA